MPKKKGKRNRKKTKASGNAGSKSSSPPATSKTSSPPKCKPEPKPGPNAQNLSGKNQNRFKGIIRSYERQEYRKGLKEAEKVLADSPFHGETLAMKGLLLQCTNKEEVGKEYIKKGLKYNLKSSICWHVFGLMHKNDGNLEQAIKCYLNALKRDDKNTRILEDLANLQINSRDYEGFQESRRAQLVNKSQSRQYWVGYAVACHLNKDYEKALQVMNNYEKTLSPHEKGDFEHGELINFKACILEEMGRNKDAADCLTSNMEFIRDFKKTDTQLARLNVKLGNPEEAVRIYEQLLHDNPETQEFHTGLQKVRGLINEDGTPVPEKIEELIAYYATLKEKFPKCGQVARAPLTFLPADARFRAEVDAYMRKSIRRSVPSLFNDLKAVCGGDAAKMKVVREFAEQYVAELEGSRRFSADDAENSEPPGAFLWALYLFAQYLDYEGAHTLALEQVERGIAHTPTAVEFYMLKARVYKHGGDVASAYKSMEECRLMDTADRYLNTKCTRYALRAGRFPDAERIVCFWLRDHCLNALQDLQVMWYQTYRGAAHRKLNEYGLAFKNYSFVFGNFKQWFNDHSDYHNYALRKMTLRAYLQLLRWMDRVRDHKFFKKAAFGSIDMYMEIYRAGVRDIQITAAPKIHRGRGGKKVVDNDPLGEGLEGTKTPLEDAAGIAKLLLKEAPGDVRSQIYAAEVFLERGRFLLVLKAVMDGNAIEAANPQLQYQIAKFYSAVDANAEKLHEITKDYINQAREDLLQGKSVEQFALDIKGGGSLPELTSSAQALIAIGAKDKAQALGKAFAVERGTLEQRLAAEAFLTGTLGASDADVAAFRASCAKEYPLATPWRSDT